MAMNKRDSQKKLAEYKTGNVRTYKNNNEASSRLVVSYL
jgi:hypothetical protein